jgi:hypothetical protein
MKLRAICVAVDYADILSLTLPYNRHHFDEMMIVTAPTDFATIHLAYEHKCELYITNSFYDDGADFNKWKALEQGLDEFGRRGWMCLLDADVLWPKKIPEYKLQTGDLYTPVRRMCMELRIQPEAEWKYYKIHPNIAEFAGYSQIFHALDPHLGEKPWHEINWRHAGGADSFFQMKWPVESKVRPPFEVLHLGPAGTNWCGRVYGLENEIAQQRYKKLSAYLKKRRRMGFEHEKL